MKTKVTNLLDEKKISYKLLPHDSPAYTCEDAAEKRNVPLNEMIKCILLVDKQGKYILACIPSDKQLDPKKVKQFYDEYSRLSFAGKGEVEETTGYTMGAIPPLLLKKEMPIIFDQSIQLLEKCNISSGDPRAGIELSTQDLISLADPWFGYILKE